MRPLQRAFRRLAGAPTSTAIALITLALAIGVNTSVFSILDAFLLRALPYPEPDRVAALVVQRQGIDPARGKSFFEDDDSFDGASWGKC
ncbi:MAG: hypothetical protein WBE37_04225 [Bryobacteraceae bacterium]